MMENPTERNENLGQPQFRKPHTTETMFLGVRFTNSNRASEEFTPLLYQPGVNLVVLPLAPYLEWDNLIALKPKMFIFRANELS